MSSILDTVITKDLFGTGAYNSLRNGGIRTIRDLVNYEGDIIHLHWIGKKTAKTITDYLVAHGLATPVNDVKFEPKRLRKEDVVALTRITKRLDVDVEPVIAYINSLIPDPN